MSKSRKQKEYKPKPSQTGTMSCVSGHRWSVVHQNAERHIVPCPVCGAQTSVNRLEKI